MPPIYGQRFGAIKVLAARMAGVHIESGTATGGSATTIEDTARFTDSVDNAARLVSNVTWYIHNGPRQGSEGRVTGSSTAGKTVTIPTGTAITSTSEYLLMRGILQTELLDSMRAALWSLGKYGAPWVDQSLIAGSPLVNATFYDNSGTFPNGWTRTGTGGTFARESTISKHGRYSASIVSDGTNAAGIRQDVLNVGVYRGASIVLRGWVFTNTTGSRVNLTLDDGIDTTTGVAAITTANRGWGTAELETPSLSVSNRATRIRASCNITAGGAVTAYFSGLWIKGGPYWTEWDIPAGSPRSIHRLRCELGGYESFFYDLVPLESLQVVRETTRRLRLRRNLVPGGRILELSGRTNWADYTVATTDDDNTFDGNAEWLATATAYNLLRARPDLDQGSRLAALRTDELRLHPITATPKPGSILIEEQ